MLKSNYDAELTPFDLTVFESFVPSDHYLRKLKAAIDFDLLRPLVADCYSPDQGRGAIDPVFLFKLSLLQFHYDLSDENIIRQAQVNMAFRFFLDLSAQASLPEPSLLSQFRRRLGAKRFTKAFQEILRQARAKGLVKDRLRLKDATHLIANIFVPSAIRLVAQTREQLLAAAESFAPDEVAAHRGAALEIRQTTSDLKDEARLLARAEHLRELVEWGAVWQERLEFGAPPVSLEVYEAFVAAIATSRKVLNDREPNATDKLLALTDTDVRRSKHGEYYDGYLLDVMIDADSDLICAIDVLAANADEAANAKNLIESEEAAHGNNVENLSIDAIGFNGAVLKALSDDPDGPQLAVFVPPKPDWSATPNLYQPEDFKLNEAGDELTCPNGETTRIRNRDGKNHGWIYRFKDSQCETCPLRSNCIKADKRTARQVSKNDFQSQYKAAKQRATTEEYKQVRKQHPGIERKLNELVRWHDGRHVRYRSRLRVIVQYLLLGIVVNCKRIVRLLTSAPAAQPA
ncbi:MAG: IS1182 family transposase [Acidobacteriota bacterium]